MKHNAIFIMNTITLEPRWYVDRTKVTEREYKTAQAAWIMDGYFVRAVKRFEENNVIRHGTFYQSHI